METSIQQSAYLTRHFLTTLMTLRVLMQGLKGITKINVIFQNLLPFVQVLDDAETVGRDFQSKSSLMWESVSYMFLGQMTR